MVILFPAEKWKVKMCNRDGVYVAALAYRAVTSSAHRAIIIIWNNDALVFTIFRLVVVPSVIFFSFFSFHAFRHGRKTRVAFARSKMTIVIFAKGFIIIIIIIIKRARARACVWRVCMCRSYNIHVHHFAFVPYVIIRVFVVINIFIYIIAEQSIIII